MKLAQEALTEAPPSRFNNSPKDRRSAPPGIPLAAVTRAASPAGTCDVRGVMLHLGPGPSQQSRVPPSPDVPSGNTLGSI